LRQGLTEYLTLDYDTAVACANDASDPAIPAAGARVQVPTLLIACRQDEVMPVENVDYTMRVIPNSSVRWIEQCGHLPMVEKPAEYLALLREFLVL
jgi:pimeloyl-ACP methyl ester carboxylesterase